MTEQQKKVDALIERVEKHQKALKLSDNQFVARYQQYLGSTRSWRERLCGRKFAELENSLGKWEKKLNVLCIALDGASQMPEFYDNLPIARYVDGIYQILQGATTDRRCAIILGNYGVGKSVNIRRLALDNPRTCTYIRANETWKDSRMQITTGIALSLGCTVGTTAGKTFWYISEMLKSVPMTVIIDEVHEGGVLLFKLVKNLIDETRVRFILASYPTAWNRLLAGSTDAYAEAQQLMGRTLKPINMAWNKGLRQVDVEKYLEAATGLNGECRHLAEKILPAVRRGGNLRLLADAIELARTNADENGEDLSTELIEDSVNELSPAQ